MYIWIIPDNVNFSSDGVILNNMGFNILAKLFLVFFAFLILIVLGQLIFNLLYPFPTQIKYGVTFSPKYAQELNLDWQEVYRRILNDLKVKDIRIPTYWDYLEPREGQFDFSSVDFMVEEAGRKEVNLIMVLGVRQPRWPECHMPSWARNLSSSEHKMKVLKFIQTVVQRYKDKPQIVAWQVENEPFLSFFGEGCEDTDEKFLQSEVELVKSKSGKKVIISDSGELGFWIVPMKLSDIFGTTLYTHVYNPFLGYITPPLLPYFYNLKSSLVKNFWAPHNQKTVIVELQGEVWLSRNDPLHTPLTEQIRIFPPEKFKKTVNFAQDTGFDEIYFWGVEWWYFMKEKGYPQYLEYAKTLFDN